MKRLHKIVAVFGVTIILSLLASPVFAGVAYITEFKAIPTDTTMSLTWVKAVGYTQTVIRSSATGYPSTPSDGTSVYTLYGVSYKQTGLIAGTTYYYTAWGYNGSSYSSDGTAAHVLMTTTASGGVNETLPTPAMDFAPTSPPTTTLTWFNTMQPFTGFLKSFEDSWGMATNTVPFTIGILILLFVGVGLYIRLKSPFVAICAVLVVDLGLIGLHLLPTYTVGVVLAFGVGVWALENIWI
jgi:hypothetical protein